MASEDGRAKPTFSFLPWYSEPASIKQSSKRTNNKKQRKSSQDKRKVTKTELERVRS